MVQIFALPFESGYFRPHHKYNGQLQLNKLPKYQGESLTTFKGQETEKIAIYSKDLIVELTKKISCQQRQEYHARYILCYR